MNRLRRSRLMGFCLLCFAATMSLTTVGCAEHHYRVYDPYYSDYHVWNHDEDVYYQRWAVETHRDPHRDFRRIPPGEQKEYWTWRHAHGSKGEHS